MSKRRFRLPSPALVISMITLSLVLGGTAVAASTAKHGDKKADTKLVKKLAPSLSVKHAKTADSATNAANATHATSADSATNATNATNATHATSATSATTATSAGNANTVGGYAPNGLTRVAYTNTSNSVSDTDGVKTIATVTLTAPSAGFVVVHADVDTQGASSTVGAMVVNVADETSGDASWFHDILVLNSGTGDGYTGDGSASAVFQVAAGVNTFDVNGWVLGTGTAPTYIDATAMFSPFGSTGGSTLLGKHSRSGTRSAHPGTNG
ncbi:MAG TPA: hypothetical protein VFU33_06960 [Gaiellaceae bacterium]|nr:hypothetical protein [Gaiellaceae bacterium]